jgi:hypothetical protein
VEQTPKHREQDPENVKRESKRKPAEPHYYKAYANPNSNTSKGNSNKVYSTATRV